MRRPRSTDDWMQLEYEVSSLFSGYPIAEEELFAGRAQEVQQMIEAILDRSKHVILYGERGVGKTSHWERFLATL